VPDEVAWKRAGGRRRYNAERRRKAEERRDQILELTAGINLLALVPGRRTGIKAELARRLGVSRSTISRDVNAIFSDLFTCPRCGRSRWSF
jgi:DNA invertase Pin-like site-specific DNA recombinase